MTQCAVWYWKHYSVYVDVLKTEEQAYWNAYTMENEGLGAVAGFQYPDGHYVEKKKDEAFKAFLAIRYEEEEREAEEYQARMANLPPVREIPAPWDASPGHKPHVARIRHDVPDWVGRQEP